MYTIQFRGKEHPENISFGSITAIYKVYSSREIGCKVQNLRNWGITAKRPFVNRKCTIRRFEEKVTYSRGKK